MVVLPKSSDVVLVPVREEHDRLGAVVDIHPIEAHAELVTEFNSLVGEGSQAAMILRGRLEGKFSF